MCATGLRRGAGGVLCSGSSWSGPHSWDHRTLGAPGPGAEQLYLPLLPSPPATPVMGSGLLSPPQTSAAHRPSQPLGCLSLHLTEKSQWTYLRPSLQQHARPLCWLRAWCKVFQLVQGFSPMVGLSPEGHRFPLNLFGVSNLLSGSSLQHSFSCGMGLDLSYSGILTQF